MAENATTITFKANISDLKKNIQEANRQIKVANAEFKAASAGMDNWSKSADGLSAKISATQKTLSAQKTILGEYKKQLELVEKEYGKNSKEADEMRIKVLNQEAAVKKTETALKGYEKELVAIEKETKKSGSAYEELGKKIEGNEKTLEELKKEYASVVLEQGKSSKAAKELAKEIEDLSKELDKDKKSFDDAGKAADNLDKSLDDTGKAADTAGAMAKKGGEGFTVMKGILADLAATAIKACVQGLKDLASATAEAWKEFDEGRDTVIKLTGATGENAKALTNAYSNVSKSILGDSSDIANAIGEVNTRFGLEGKALETLSGQYVKFANITDADVIGTIDDTQKALAAYGKGVESAAGFLDSLAKTSQATGVDTSTLTSGIISNATAFQEMGLSLNQAVAFMGQLEKSGTNSETVLNGMRKALKNSAKDGKDLATSLLELQNSIEGNGDSTKGLQAAYDLFGKSGDQIYGAIKNGTLSFKDLTSAVNDSKGAVNSTYAETLDASDRLKLKLQETKITLAETFDSFLQDNGPMLEKAIDDVGGALIGAIPSIRSALDTVIPYITNFIKNDLPPLLDKIKTELPKIIDAIIKEVPVIIRTIKEAIPVVLELIRTVTENKDKIIATVKGIVAILTGSKIIQIIMNISTAVSKLGGLFGGLGGKLSGALSSVGSFFSNIFTTIGSGLSTAASSIASFFTADLGATLASGGAAAIGTALTAIAGSIASFFAGAEIGKKIGAFLFPDDADLYEHYSGIMGTLEMLRDFFITIGEEIAYAWADLTAAIGEAWNNLKESIIAIWQAVVAAITILWDGIKQAALNVWTAIQGAWLAAAEWFNSSVITPILTFFTNLWEGIKSAAGAVWEFITGVWQTAADWFNGSVIEPILGFFTNLWDNVKTFASDAWDGIVSIFEGAVEWFTTIFQGVSDAIEKIMGGVANIVKKPINSVIDLLNKFIDGINKIQIPDWVPEFGGKGINIKHISKLARGGVLEKGQTGFLEGNGAEAVVPLENNKKWIAAVTGDLKKALRADGMLGGSGGNTVIGGSSTTYTFNQYNNSPKALSRLEIYRQTRNQLSFANNGGAVNA